MTPVDDDTARRQVAKALEDLFGMIDDGVLVRDIRRDLEPDWWKRAAALVMVLKRATMAIETAREKGWIG